MYVCMYVCMCVVFGKCPRTGIHAFWYNPFFWINQLIIIIIITTRYYACLYACLHAKSLRVSRYKGASPTSTNRPRPIVTHGCPASTGGYSIPRNGTERLVSLNIYFTERFQNMLWTATHLRI